jgi:hypothetical protein
LSHLIRDIKDKKGDKSPRDKDKSKKKEVLMVHGQLASSSEARKKEVEPWTQVRIDFPAPTNKIKSSPMVISTTIGRQEIHRVYLDGGSASEILYGHCFLQLEESERASLVASNTPLVGFSGEKVLPLGKITLPVTFGVGQLSREEDMTFLVVRSPSRYNVIIGRPGIGIMGAIVSTSHPW